MFANSGHDRASGLRPHHPHVELGRPCYYRTFPPSQFSRATKVAAQKHAEHSRPPSQVFHGLLLHQQL